MGSAIYTSISHFQVQTNDCIISLIFSYYQQLTQEDLLDVAMLRLSEPGQEPTAETKGAGAQHHNNKATGSTRVNWARPRRASFTAASAAKAHSQSPRVRVGLCIARVRRRGER